MSDRRVSTITRRIVNDDECGLLVVSKKTAIVSDRNKPQLGTKRTIETMKWSSLPSLPQKVTGHVGVAIDEHRLFVAIFEFAEE